jgi:hypothetical protein
MAIPIKRQYFLKGSGAILRALKSTDQESACCSKNPEGPGLVYRSDHLHKNIIFIRNPAVREIYLAGNSNNKVSLY